MTERLTPSCAAEAADIIKNAVDSRSPLIVQGAGTKVAIGAPVSAEKTISSIALDGIRLYEPSELVIAARAGTPIEAVTAELAKNGQRLAFDPVTYQGLLASEGKPTIGGLAAANLSGPRRIAFGAARDSLIGIEMINGKGEIIKNGGRVMKNVTGYDLTKLVCGSWGTLGLLTEVFFKLQPMPETELTLSFSGLDDEKAIALLCDAMGSPFEVTSAAHLPASQGGTGAESQTILRIEGFEASLTYRSGELEDLLSDYGAPQRLEEEESKALWAQVADVSALKAQDEDLVWKLSLKPSNGPKMGAWLREQLGAKLLYDWSGGLVWASIDPAQAGEDGGAKRIREKLATLGGHATLIKGPQDLRSRMSSFQPQNGGLAQLSKAAKLSFDPYGLFNPGRMSERKGA
ncbi:MAG: FAD-binding protein [Cohaesibacter sp.]|jgi:glycolate oxidase FAD binding subunit|nr:FAD-binding protein [Cohaesibacter sp.]